LSAYPQQLHCQACGKGFAGYTPLMQHLAAAHGGVNSVEAKLTQLKQLNAAAATSAERKHGNVRLGDLFDTLSTAAPKPPPAKKGFAINVTKGVKVRITRSHGYG
jgi:hypothetical protein